MGSLKYPGSSLVKTDPVTPPQSHPVPDFTIVTLKWHNMTLNCRCHLSSLLTGMLLTSDILLNMIVLSSLFHVCYQNWLLCLKQEHQMCLNPQQMYASNLDINLGLKF